MNREEEPRGNWYLLTGLILGLAAGLALSLYFFPVRYSDSEPSALRDQIEDLIAANVRPECLQKPDERGN